ncbi:MAG: hypothetical protein H6Q06_587 [Acidobacteria bacterium]|nr:hypothetical protein [Acidobacteriota bacterium]
MHTDLSPMRWPAEWGADPSALDALKGTAINCLLVEGGPALDPVIARARREGIRVVKAGTPPAGVKVIEGEWPGVKLSESGVFDHAAAGPTGVPWVDSNGWKVRLTAALNPDTEVWVDASPRKPRLSGEAYATAVADAAAYGGRWVISLDSQIAEGIAARSPEALERWRNLTAAAGHFAGRNEWSRFVPEAVIGIISDFTGRNEFMSRELLNLVARTNQQYRIIVRSAFSLPSLNGLKAVLYADEEGPGPGLRKQILEFVEAGGMLITGPRWGELPGTRAPGGDHPRYVLMAYGRGRLAVATPDFEDPYVVANDSVVLISHRYELLRFWNGGAVGSYFTAAPDRKRAVVHMLFYAFILGDNRPTVRVSGRYRTARLWTLDQPAPRDLNMEVKEDAVELHLPPVRGYAAAELEV